MSENSLQSSCLSRGIQRCGFHICVLGTIGAGKTTLTKALQEVIAENEGRCEGFYEPVSGNPLLQLFYKDKNRYALSMQIYMLNRRLEQQIVIQDLALSGVSCVQDSSVFGDTCFVEMLANDGVLCEEEVNVYSELFMNMSRNVMYPSLIVYINCPSEVALSRIAKRGREFETGIELDYLGNLNQQIKTLVAEFNRYTHCIEIDGRKDLTEDGIKDCARNVYELAKELRKQPILNRIGV